MAKRMDVNGNFVLSDIEVQAFEIANIKKLNEQLKKANKPLLPVPGETPADTKSDNKKADNK